MTALPSSDRWVLCQALVLLPVSGLILRMIGLRRTYELAQKAAGVVRDQEGADLYVRANRIATLIQKAADEGPYHAACLETAVVSGWILARQGIDQQLRIGVRKRRGVVEAHAWLEHRGQPLAGHDESWVSLPSLEWATGRCMRSLR